MTSDDPYLAALFFALIFYLILIIWIPPLVVSWLICKFAKIKDNSNKKRLRTWIFLYFYSLHLILPVLITIDLATDPTNKKGNEWVIYPIATVMSVLGFIKLTKYLIVRYRVAQFMSNGKASKKSHPRMELIDDIVVILPALISGAIVLFSVILSN